MNPQRSKILVVDDSEIALELTRIALEEGGHQVVTTDSPFGFSALLREENPDLALVDVSMPCLRGDKLVEIAHRHVSSVPVGEFADSPPSSRRRCPIVLYSNRPLRELRQLAARCGAAGFIQKSGDSEELLREVSRFLEASVAGN